MLELCGAGRVSAIFLFRLREREVRGNARFATRSFILFVPAVAAAANKKQVHIVVSQRKLCAISHNENKEREQHSLCTLLGNTAFVDIIPAMHQTEIRLLVDVFCDGAHAESER